MVEFILKKAKNFCVLAMLLVYAQNTAAQQIIPVDSSFKETFDTQYRAYLSAPIIIGDNSSSNARIDLSIQPISLPNQSDRVSLFILSFMALLLFAFVKRIDPKKFSLLFKRVLSPKRNPDGWEDQQSYYSLANPLLFIAYAMGAALFIYPMAKYHSLSQTADTWLILLILIIGIILIYLIKFFIHYLLGTILGVRHLGELMVTNTMIVNNLITALCLPLVFLLVFAHHQSWSIYIHQIVVAIFFTGFTMRLYRIVSLSNTYFSYPKFYLFTYLCCLEISPWIIFLSIVANLNLTWL